jgi:hypothetical protein
VASWFGRNTSSFRTAASKTACGGVVSVHHGAGRGWRRVRCVMPCGSVCSAVQEKLCMHGNMVHSLGALGGAGVSGWHGHGITHGGSRFLAARGIGLRGGCEAGGEVTGPGSVGTALPTSGVHGGHGINLGRERG